MIRLLAAMLVACSGAGPSAPTAPPPRVQAERPSPERAAFDRMSPAEREKALADKVKMADNPNEGKKLRTIKELGPDEPAFVALIVIDTLRADRTSFCGFEHPTTPNLDALREQRAIWTCDAYSPATWTLPSHASYFTGVNTADHGVHTHGTPLGDNFETLAEIYSARGYQTLLMSGNPVFASGAGGFWQGFDRIVSDKALVGPMRGGAFEKLVGVELARIDRTRPLFLMVNIFDAHDPYPPVPEGVPWAKAAPRLNLQPYTPKPESPYYRFVTGTMSAEERPAYLDSIQAAYAWAIHEADDNLGQLLRLLRADGWFKQQARVVVTSDHGEHLGEHQLLRHGSASWQTVTRVPFLYWDGSGKGPAELPRPMNVTNAFYLLRDGRLPEAPLLVESASMVNKDDFKPSFFTVALWSGPTEKLMHIDGKEWRYDLQADPLEERGLPIPADNPMLDLLHSRVKEQWASFEKAMATAPNPELMEMLKAAGYVTEVPGRDEAAPANPPSHH